jgi:amidophosphoribosyltransferase
LANLGFRDESIKSLPPGHAITVVDNEFKIERFADPRPAHCYFEWIYFANVASTIDDRSVYLARKSLGEELAQMETVPPGPDLIVVPVPDTSKAAADAMAYALNVPSVEGLIRNRYAGRTFIEGHAGREAKAAAKYTPLRDVLEGRRILLVEDSIVRSTTMRVLISKIRELGHAKEIHVRVACPPIIAPCFYGIDMSRIRELYAPPFLAKGLPADEMYAQMAADLGADSLRYLPVEAIARAVGKPAHQLCQACITGDYPTPWGQKLYKIALDNYEREADGVERTYETATR